MAKELTLSGCAASAQAVKMAKVDVICSYPIRPYTAAMMELAKMVAEGELDAEFIHGEGEHAQLSVVYGASACGGNLLHEVRSALYDAPKRPLTTSFMAGLGGDVIRLEEFYSMAKVMAEAVERKKFDTYVHWVGFEAEA